MKLNPPNKVETIKVKLSEEKTPIAFKNKREALDSCPESICSPYTRESFEE